jgi:hypothetical protein
VPKEADVQRWNHLKREERALLEHLGQARSQHGKAFGKWLLSKSRAELTAPVDPSAQLAAKKTLHGNPGAHQAVPTFEIGGSVDYLSRHLR